MVTQRLLAAGLVFPLLAVATPAPQLQNQKRYLHITDVHFDPFYVPNSDVKTQCHRRGEDGEKGERALHYGSRGTGCDSPLALVSDAFASIQSEVMNRQPVDVVFWTGDSSRHDRDAQASKEESEVYSQNAEVVYYIQKTFDLYQTAVIPAIGNWDVSPHNTLADHAVTSLAKLYETWKPVLETGLSPEAINRTKTTFLSGGWFDRDLGTVNNKVVLRAFSLNTLYWFAENPGVEDCAPFVPGSKPERSTHSGDTQLAWLWGELEAARNAGQKVILIGHIPPTDSSDQSLYKPQCFQWYLQLSGEFSDVILSQYYGHVNKDVVNLVLRPRKNKMGTEMPYLLKAVTPMSLPYLDMKTYTIVGNMKTSASIVPVHNPGLKTGILSIEKDSRILRESQWFADITHANERYAASPGTPTLRFKEACRTDADYNMSGLDAAGYTDWVIRMQRELADETAQLSASMKSKKRPHPLRAYSLCIDSNEKMPHPNPDAQLSLPPGVVRAVLIVAGLVFVGALGGFYFYVQHLETQGNEAERQRLLFRPVEPQRLRRAQSAAERVRSNPLDSQGITI
ncbi:hypothetical protein DFJ77DRAFT_469606 [Powellomyces hirtus]|nr:hypothetical protein DFJ77DRAFT_469606 [Powellomyces hirtus]